MNLHATSPVAEDSNPGAGAPQSPLREPPGRFTYSTGARPLPGCTIKRGIGHGGFGEVYYATSDAGKEVALKLIRRNLDIELRGVTQCLNLKHPNLLALFDVRADEHGDNWVVMELMSGQSLEDVLAQHPAGLPPDEALAWLHGIAAGVAYLHEHGIVHRDLKPGNIFADEGLVKIGDYGLSKFISCSRRSGQTGSVGTVHYMAPEVANGRYGKEIDIYAVGVIIYEVLTGHVPFEGESIGEILMKHLTAQPDVSRLAEPYRTIVARALAKDPDQRFHSVRELIELLPPAPAGVGDHFAGPSPAVARRTAVPLLGKSAEPSSGFSLAPEVAAASPSKSASSSSASPATDPVLRWVLQVRDDVVAWWDRKNFQPIQKLFILGGVCFLAFNMMPIWLPPLALAVGAYLIYRFVSMLSADGPPASQVNSGGRPISTRQQTLQFLRPFGIAMVAAFGLAWIVVGLDKGFNIDFGQHMDDAWEALAWIGPIVLLVYFGYVGSQRSTRKGHELYAPSREQASAVQHAQRPQLEPYRGRFHESPTRRRWRHRSTAAYYQIATPRQRLTQLFGSMLLSGAVCAVVSLLAFILRSESPEPAQYTWLALATTLGSWSVMVPAKLWEGSQMDAALRRFVMLVAGLVFGTVCYGLLTWLVVPLPYGHDFLQDGPGRALQGKFFEADGAPKWIAFLAYFGFLYVIPRWWRLADPLRSTRLSIWHTGVAIFWSAVISAFWPFPQPWGLMVAATIAIAVQLASPWVDPHRRTPIPAEVSA